MKTRIVVVWCLVVVAGIVFSGCMGMESYTRKDGTVVYGDEETLKKERARDEMREQKTAELKNAERRKDNEPITVALHRPQIAANLKGSLNENIMYDMVKKEFQSDPIIRLVDQNIVDASEKKTKTSMFQSDKNTFSVDADISVFVYVSYEKTLGVSKKTGKVGQMVAIEFKSEVISHYMAEDKYNVEESGNIFNNVQVTKSFAKKICDLIKTKPFIPSLEYKRKMQGQQKQQLEDALKGLIK